MRVEIFAFSRETLVDLSHAYPREVRELIRTREYEGVTSGLCLGYLQANLVALTADIAAEFVQFCVANPGPMPLIDITEPGNPTPRRVAPTADLRTDLSLYRIYRHGKLDSEVNDVRDVWRDDMVGFLLGCSFTAEARLLQAGIRLRHIELGQNVPMFLTSINCKPVGRFHGPVVVSMRPIAAHQIDLAISVTAAYPLAHGAPIHIGDPREIGIDEISQPDFGDALEVLADECPVFWPCGVTPQAVISAVRPELAITHSPGHMFITDVPDTEILDRGPLLG
jgi:uncharacterized protein YcsI (UPF0317 family)